MSIDSRRVTMDQRPVEVCDQQSRVGVVTHATISVMESYLSEIDVVRDTVRKVDTRRYITHVNDI